MKRIYTLLLGAGVLCFFLSACSKVKEPSSSSSQSTLNPNSNLAYASTGIGSGSLIYNLSDSRDLVVPIDFNNTGHARQLICYRPGTGTIWVLDNTGATDAPFFVTVAHTNGGVGPSGSNYNLADSRDRIVPYDMDGTGHLNYIICYRPGGRAFWIFKCAPNPGNPTGSQFTLVLQSSYGVGTPSLNYDLSNSNDIIVPFDFYGTGKSTQLMCYRPGGKACWVMNNSGGSSAPLFAPVYRSSSGIGEEGGWNFDLSESRDLVLPFDFNGSGIKDGVICYRPGSGVVYTFNRDLTNTKFASQGISTSGIWDYNAVPIQHYDMSSTSDRIIPYDIVSSGATNNIVCYRAGGGVCYMFHGYDGLYGTFAYGTTAGIGSGTTYYDLSSSNDKVFAYDCNGTGKLDHLVCYRPGGSVIWIFSNATLQKIY